MINDMINLPYQQSNCSWFISIPGMKIGILLLLLQFFILVLFYIFILSSVIQALCFFY